MLQIFFIFYIFTKRKRAVETGPRRHRGRLVRWNPWESGGIGIQFPGIPMFGWFLRMELESGGGNEFHQMREFRILQHMEGIQIP